MHSFLKTERHIQLALEEGDVLNSPKFMKANEPDLDLNLPSKKTLGLLWKAFSKE